MATTDSKSGLNYAIGVDATILATPVAGLVKGGNEEIEVLILPTKVETVQTLNFDTLLKEIATQFKVPAADITKAMDGISAIFPSFDPKKLTFQLNQIFFHYKKEKKAEGATQEPEATTEYAFSIKINLGGILELAGIISIDTLYLAIWNTNRESVLKQFNMADISALLPE